MTLAFCLPCCTSVQSDKNKATGRWSSFCREMNHSTLIYNAMPCGLRFFSRSCGNAKTLRYDCSTLLKTSILILAGEQVSPFSKIRGSRVLLLSTAFGLRRPTRAAAGIRERQTRKHLRSLLLCTNVSLGNHSSVWALVVVVDSAEPVLVAFEDLLDFLGFAVFGFLLPFAFFGSAARMDFKRMSWTSF